MPVLLFNADGKELSIQVTTAVVIGRSDECELPLKDGLVSKRHCVIEPLSEGWQIRDLGSSNGTWIDGQRITQQLLGDLVQIQIGRAKVRFVADLPSATAAVTDDLALAVLNEIVPSLAQSPDESVVAQTIEPIPEIKPIIKQSKSPLPAATAAISPRDPDSLSTLSGRTVSLWEQAIAPTPVIDRPAKSAESQAKPRAQSEARSSKLEAATKPIRQMNIRVPLVAAFVTAAAIILGWSVYTELLSSPKLPPPAANFVPEPAGTQSV